MSRLLFVLGISAGLAGLAGCSTTAARIRANPDYFAALDPATQQAITRGEVQPGWTPEMVQLALGKPSEVHGGMAGTDTDATWIYRNSNRNDNDYVRAGFRRRVVFDPVRRSNVITVEPVDPRLFPQLTPHSIHISFRDGRVTEIERVDER